MYMYIHMYMYMHIFVSLFGCCVYRVVLLRTCTCALYICMYMYIHVLALGRVKDIRESRHLDQKRYMYIYIYIYIPCVFIQCT